MFFGSTDDSLLVLKKLHQEGYEISCVVTQPPRPVGRKQVTTPTPTEVWAKQQNISVVSFPNQKEPSFLYENERTVIDTLEPFKADLLISASYGQKIPTKIITDAKFGGLNVHPSLLPRWRGPAPVPWEILSGDHQTGVTIITLTEQMDEGKIVAQKKTDLTENDEHIELRTKLFHMGADLLVSILPDYLNGKINLQPQDNTKSTWARRLTREDGFIPWEVIQKAMEGKNVSTDDLPMLFQQIIKESEFKSQESELISRAIRALSPWPGVWTLLRPAERDYGHLRAKASATERGQAEKRLKILKGHVEKQEGKEKLALDEVQLEGKNPIDFQTFNNTVLNR